MSAEITQPKTNKEEILQRCPLLASILNPNSAIVVSQEYLSELFGKFVETTDANRNSSIVQIPLLFAYCQNLLSPEYLEPLENENNDRRLENVLKTFLLAGFEIGSIENCDLFAGDLLWRFRQYFNLEMLHSTTGKNTVFGFIQGLLFFGALQKERPSQRKDDSLEIFSDFINSLN